jgi:tRNA pseudouridine65 synthase
VLLETARYLVVAKPSGLAVHRGASQDPVTALDLVRGLLGRWAYPVHRLDRGTSGALLFAVDPESAGALHGIFEAGQVEKRYIALVRGVPPEEGVINHPIPRREGGPRVRAVTAYRRLCVGAAHRIDCALAGAGCSLVEAWPRTGRLHQLRRHLKHIGHPVIGDSTYGKGVLNRALRERHGLSRLALHAAELVFVDPWSGAPVRAVAPLPADLEEPLARMGLVVAPPNAG